MAAVVGYVGGVVFLGFLCVMLMKMVKHLQASWKKSALYRALPQGPSNPIFGHLFYYPGPDERGLAYQREMTTKFPKCSLAWMISTPMLVVNHPETVKIVLRSSEPKGRRVYNLIRPWIGDGLLTSSGAKWARNRRLLTPAFHFEILKNYIHLKNQCADMLVTKFEHAAKESAPFYVFANVTMFTLDVILLCAMSYETNCQTLGERHPYVQAVNQMSELLVTRFFQPWFHGDWLYFLTPSGREMRKHCDYVHKVAEDIISNRREKLKELDLSSTQKDERRHKCMDFLDILLTAKDENGTGLTNDEIRDEVDTFLFEGHDTTASAISWALYSIAEHQDVQKRIQEEVDDLLSGRSKEDILWEDLPALPYLTRVIKEAMRLHTPVPFIQRELTADTEIDGRIVPAGTMINVVIYNCHHNPAVWPDSLKFDPDRFLPENVEKRDAFAFIPFSAGPRNCIGQTFAMDEIKIALARIMHRFNLRLDPKQTVEKSESLVMRVQEDIRLFVSER